MELLTRYHDKKSTNSGTSSGSVWGGISKQLRAPAGSRLQKLHNVGLALKSLYGHLGTPSCLHGIVLNQIIELLNKTGII